MTYYLPGNKDSNDWAFLSGNYGYQNKVALHFQSAEKKLLTHNTVSSENILQQWRWKKTFSAEGKLGEFVAIRTAPQYLLESFPERRKWYWQGTWDITKGHTTEEENIQGVEYTILLWGSLMWI